MPSAAVYQVVEKTINGSKLIGDLLSPAATQYLISNSLVRPIKAGTVLCDQNLFDATVYMIINGAAQVSAGSPDTSVTLGTVQSGELVGELSALFNIPRVATVRLVRDSVVLEIPEEVFQGVLNMSRHARDTLTKRCMHRLIETTLRQVPVFHNLDHQAFTELCYLSSIVTKPKNTIIAHEGKTERSMYVVCSGVARVYITVDMREIPVTLLRSGDYFGEYSLFSGHARTASVSAMTDLQLVVLEGEAFDSFIDYNEDTERDIGDEARRRKIRLDDLRAQQSAHDLAHDRFTEMRQILDRL